MARNWTSIERVNRTF